MKMRFGMKKVPVEVTGISSNAPYQGYVVILKEKNGSMLMPIFIGVAEAHNINLLLQGIKYIRPLTYDLFHSLLDIAGAQIDEVTISDLRDNTFFAEVRLNVNSGRKRSIDARPSDAIALAIKTRAQIYVNNHVMAEAGFDARFINIRQSIGQHIEQKIKTLNQKLNHAVEQEAYEDAAKIRDLIRELEHKEVVDK